MGKLILLALLLAFSISVSASETAKYIIAKDEIDEICEITPDSYQFDEGGFPFIVDKFKVKVNDSNCGIKATFTVYKYISESFAENKFGDLKKAHIAMNIPLKPVDGDMYRMKWENSVSNKMVFLRKQSEFVFIVAINSNSAYYEKLNLLALQKYDKN